MGTRRANFLPCYFFPTTFKAALLTPSLCLHPAALQIDDSYFDGLSQLAKARATCSTCGRLSFFQCLPPLPFPQPEPARLVRLQISPQDIAEFERSYKGSAEESEELKELYTKHRGNMKQCANVTHN